MDHSDIDDAACQMRSRIMAAGLECYKMGAWATLKQYGVWRDGVQTIGESGKTIENAYFNMFGEYPPSDKDTP